jgi:alpha-1,3-rhamnosyl/mannosyltransferase
VSVAQVQARYGLPRRWFVFPSFTWNHKNHDMLLRAFAMVAAQEHDTMLVLTGGEGPAEQLVVEQIARMGLRGRVRRTGLIPRRDVLAIVRGAVAMTFPSRYEGVGLPVLEAMSVGTPVLAAAVAALPEVVGDAGRLIPPDDAAAWAAEMIRMLEDGDERRRLADAGRIRVADFTWQRTAAATVAAYRSAAATIATAANAATAGTAASARSAPRDAALPAAALGDAPLDDHGPGDAALPAAAPVEVVRPGDPAASDPAADDDHAPLIEDGARDEEAPS